ncbi:hypothetical protein RUM43_003583 [Polyplax serrata]|uniref:Uncharacterized protein n=1 Tax=Polyplax serrata TaxID=468196 RepID=A0AAN8S3A0_POLSC
MRRASYTNKLQLELQEEDEKLIPEVEHQKWIDIWEKEETDLFILSLREEIVQKCLNTIYENYLNRQVVTFTVHCAYLAWVKAIGIYYMFKDPGDSYNPEVRGSWEPDEEPEPSVIDSWGSQCIKAFKPQPLKREKGKDLESTLLPPIPDVINSPPNSTDTYEEGECEAYNLEEFSESTFPKPHRERSIFSKTLSMSKESLLLIEPLAVNECRAMQVHAKKEDRSLKKS